MASRELAVSLGAVNERRLRPVYEHLDNGNNKHALHEAEKVLKKQKDLSAAKVLKTIALHRLGRGDEAYALSQEVASIGPVDENSLQGLSLYYREIQRPDLIPPVYEAALSKCPGNEEYLTHLFMSYVRTENPKEMQRVALSLFKSHPKNPYLFWGIMAILMQAMNDEKLGKTMFLPLAEKMVEKHIEKGKAESEAEVRLYLMILDMMGKHDKALQVLEGEHAKHLSVDAEGLSRMKMEVHTKLGKWGKVNSKNKSLLIKEPDIWNHVVGYLDSLQHLVERGSKPEDCDDPGTSSENPDYTWDDAARLLLEMKRKQKVEAKRVKRGPFLAVMEIHKILQTLKSEKAADASKVLEELGSLVDLIVEYTEVFATKPCCFEDLELYLKILSEQDKSELLEKINGHVFSSVEAEKSENDSAEENNIWKHLLHIKMQRYLGHHDSLNREEKLKIVCDLLQRHEKGLKHSSYRPVTDIRVVDDYCLLAANMMVDLYRKEGCSEDLWKAVYILELGKQRSPVNFEFKFVLIRLYCEVGIFMPCAQIYDSLDIKHMQQDTLGFIVCNSISTLGHYQLASQAFEASRAYFVSNDKDSLEFLIACFRNGTFHKVSEFTSFRSQVKNSLHSAMTITEHTYMDLITQADIDVPFSELLESSCLPKQRIEFDKLTDNRDFTLRFDWVPEHRYLNHNHIQTSFNLEKKWVRFREIQVRALIALLKDASQPATAQERTNHVDLNSLLQELEEVVEDSCKGPDLDVEFPFHGPPYPRIKSLSCLKYQQISLSLLRLFKKILNEISKPGTENELKKNLESVISGIEEVLSSTGLVSDWSKVETKSKSHKKKKPVKHDHCHGDCDHGDHMSCVTSSPEGSVQSATSLPVPDTLKTISRIKLERLVLSCELFSTFVLLAYNFSLQIFEIKSHAMKKRRRKKGKEEPLPSLIHFYHDVANELKQVGEKVKFAVTEMQSVAETMTLDLSKTDLKEKLSNGDLPTMQQQTGTNKTPPTKTTPLPDQLVHLASGSILNSTEQLLKIVEGRLENLKAIKV